MTNTNDLPIPDQGDDDLGATSRKKLRDWVEAYAADRPEIVRKDAVQAAYAEFLADDTFVLDIASALVRQEVTRAMQAGDRVKLGGGRSVTRDELNRRAATRRGDVWDRWRDAYTRTRPDGTVVGLLDMTRSDLIEEATGRRDIARTALIDAGFLRALAESIGDDGETVRDHYQPNHLDDLMRRTEARFTRGDQ